MRKTYLWFLIAVVGLWAAVVGNAQTPKLEPNVQTPAAKPPSVTFDFNFPGATPEHYSIAVESSGRAAYRCDDPTRSDAKAGDPYIVKFVVSEPTRARIFDLAKALNYFHGDFDYRKTRVANMGIKTVTYTNGEKESHTSYNYTTNSQLQELTALFQSIGATLDHGRQLTYLYRYDKLGLDAETKQMEADAKNNRLAELQAVQPILEKIANDHGVINVTRRRAEYLLSLVKSNPAAEAAAPN